MSLCTMQLFYPDTRLCKMMLWFNDLTLLCSCKRPLLVMALPIMKTFPWLRMKVQRDSLLCGGRLNMHLLPHSVWYLLILEGTV